MDWCGSSTPRTPEYRTMNQERHERKAYWLVVRPQFLTGKDTKRLCPPSLWDGRAVGFHVVKELNNENRWRVPDRIDRGDREPSLSRLYYRGLWGSRNRRALILGWAYYLDAFSSYPLRTWLPSVYRGHDNWYTRATALPLGTVGSLRPTFVPARRVGLAVKLPSAFALEGPISVRPEGNLCTPPLPFGRPTPHRNCLPETVPWPVVRIFTDMSISPSLSPRQCPDRYAFRAGRNLPDKEFRYLRTVIVTAAVHRGFGRRLPCHQVTNFLDLPALGGRQPHTWSYDFAETCVFGKQSPGPGHCDPLCEEAPLLPKLRGYFAEFLRESCLAPLGILYLPTCVGFGYRYPFVEGRSSFSWEYGMGYFSAVAPGTRTLARGIFSTPSYPALKKQGIFTCCPSTTPFGLILGPDSPSVDEPCGGTLRFSGHWILTNVCVTQADILASASSTPARAASADQQPRSSSAQGARSVSYYALFSGWLLLGKPPGCLCTPTSFITERHAVRDQFSPPTAWELTVSCSISLPDGVLFTFPSRYYFAIGHPGYLALQGGPCGFTRDSTCPMLLGSGAVPISLAATTGIAFCFLFLWLLRCFSSPGCLLPAHGFSSSSKVNLFGNLRIYAYFQLPKHFVACYALPRLWVPRYPP
ncbi:hypothetical protein H6P81_000002 [Aristolochia fimbriata]|uniref:Uncharacterized protein n=1 Tax=Aristolochia fimbriata TaxID=158543 RepID=A0AAV7F450_ARIFI|nr:hypothetical protein H6P81_000002 [Aristolochia fimbriata]